MDLRDVFVANLRRLRHAKGLSQDDLAYEANMGRRAIEASRQALNPLIIGTVIATPPMTLGNMRANGVRSLIVCCSNVTCRHEAIVNVDNLRDGVPVPSLGPCMRCQRCGQLGADARPNWNERPNAFATRT